MATITPAELQKMRLKRDQEMKLAEQSRLKAQALQQKEDQMRNAPKAPPPPVKPPSNTGNTGSAPKTPPPPVKPAPRVITDPIQPKPVPSPAPMPAGGSGAPAPGTERMISAPPPPGATYKKGGKVASKYASFSKTGKPAGMKSVTKMASGGSVSKASSRGDGIAQRGKTRGRMC